MREADAVDLLTDDHLEVGALFKQYEKLAKKEAPAAQRQPLAQTICAMPRTHTTIEEILYPAARRAGIDADLLDEADIEHASAKELMGQIEAGNPEDDHYDAKVKVLGEYITHHVVEEHTEMFPKCRRSSMDLVGLRAEMEARKMSLMATKTTSASACRRRTTARASRPGSLPVSCQGQLSVLRRSHDEAGPSSRCAPLRGRDRRPLPAGSFGAR